MALVPADEAGGAEESPSQKPVLLTLDDDRVLTGLVKEEAIQWEWSRPVQAIGMQTDKEHLYLKRNVEHFQKEFIFSEIPWGELHYRGKGAADAELHHTMSSRALVLMVALVSLNRRFAVDVKRRSITLLCSVLRKACMAIVGVQMFIGTIFGDDGQWHQGELNFNCNGVTNDLHNLLAHNANALAVWESLTKSAWCQCNIQSHISCATLWDVMLFCLWCKANMQHKKVWQLCAQHLWPKLVNFAGKVLEQAGLQSCDKGLKPVPLLKSKKGHSRRVPFVNKYILLHKCKKAKRHRQAAMQTHADLVPNQADIVSQEDMMEAALYIKRAQEAYAGCNHFAISWDPSNYDCETMVAILYSCQNGVAAYCPIQNMSPVLTSEVDEEIRKLSAVNALTRIDGYNEIRALSHALSAYAMPLEKFVLPKDILWRPLTSSQERVWIQGKPHVWDKECGWKRPQFPETYHVKDLPLLISISDQGGINRAGLDYCTFKIGLAMLPLWDPYHRTWNDVKSGLKATASLWKAFLSFALFFNTNYGPAGSKTFFAKKQALMAEFMASRSAHADPFLAYLPYIQAERGQPEPEDNLGRESVFNSLPNMNGFCALGPLTKLMRWWSWFQCEDWHQGECMASKMVMLDNLLPQQGCDFIPEVAAVKIPNSASAKKELTALKMQHGTFKLAAMLITPASLFQKDLIAEVCRPIWTKHSQRVQTVLTPKQVMDHTVFMAGGGWKEELVDIVKWGLCNHQVFRKLYPDGCTTPEGATDEYKDLVSGRLRVHIQFVLTLLEKRGSSLAATFLRPPVRYAQLMVPNCRQDTLSAMLNDWKKLLGLEEKYAHGSSMKALEAVHCLQNCWVRLLFLVGERDHLCKGLEAVELMRATLEHMGDTQCVENTHQAAKDCLRDARHNVRSRVHKMSAVIGSSVFKTRKVQHISVSISDKAEAKLRQLPKIIPMTHPSSHKVQKQFHQMMRHKGKDHWWPSTSAVSQYHEVTSFEWLMQDAAYLSRVGYDSACLTCLLSNGSCVASQDHQAVYLTISVGFCGFLGWAMEALPGKPGDEFPSFKVIPQPGALVFRHVDSLEKWIDIPVKGSVQADFGPIIFAQVAKARQLPVARIQEGLSLTVAQAKHVLSHLNVHLPGQPSRPQVYRALIEIFVHDEEGREAAMARSKANTAQAPEEDELDEGYEELLDLVEDALNQGDPDLRQEKEKMKKKEVPKHFEGRS